MKSWFLLLRSYCLVASLLLLMAFRFAHAQQASSSSSCADPEAHRVIAYERKPVGSWFPSYRLEVCDDGTVTYLGIENVRMIGRVQFVVDAKKVDPLFIALWKLNTGFWPYREEMPRRRLKTACVQQGPYCEPDGGRDRRDKIVLDLELPWTNRKTVSSAIGHDGLFFDLQVRDLLEKHVPTIHLRCPVTVSVGFVPRPGILREIEVCTSMLFDDQYGRKQLREIEGKSE